MTNTQPYGINDQGLVSGYWQDAGGAFDGFAYQPQNRTFTSIDVPASVNGQALLFGGNSAGGMIAGGYQDNTAAGFYHAGVYNTRTGAWTFLPEPDPSSQFNLAGGVNNAGQVTGNWTNNLAAFTNNHGWVYQNGKYTFFDVPVEPPVRRHRPLLHQRRRDRGRLVPGQQRLCPRLRALQ